MAYFAHSTVGSDKAGWQPLSDHLVKVSNLAGARAQKFGAEKAAALAGLLHDLGKYTPGFQRRLEGGERVDHATAGAQEARCLAECFDDRMIAEIVAYAIAGHHTGLPDKTGESGSLAERLEKSLENCDPVWRAEVTPEASSLMPPFDWIKDRLPFQLGVLGRMIFSCLVDADFRDTEAFYARTEGYIPDRTWPSLVENTDKLIAAFNAEVRRKNACAPATKLNQLRAGICSHVRGQATGPQGLFTLTVPTGGGKTLTSLAFALDHARAHSLERIIYAIPFTSIIDQTAKIFRDVLGQDVVLEHHSSVEEERPASDEANCNLRQGKTKLQLAMEDWAAPIVVTTNVQLFESLFANRPSRCRKLHNISRSVIVLDEAQTIPLPYLQPCLAMLDELLRNYGVSVVLCTATQPALTAPEFKGLLDVTQVRELAPEPKALYQQLKRVTIRRSGELGDDELVEALAGTSQGMVIVNSRRHALTLYRKASAAGLDGAMHLSTRQHAADRKAKLAEIKFSLRDQLPCRLIATSLVEAGVDIDFANVWRAEAGLDQIAQAAGRCNREGKYSAEESIVTIFRAPDHPPPREIAQFADALNRIQKHDHDLLSLDAIHDYFREIYWQKGERLDGKKVVEKFRCDSTGTDFAYRSVAEDFRLIESGLLPVIVMADTAARNAVDSLRAPNISAGRVARQLQPYLVQVPPRERAKMITAGHVQFIESSRFADQFAVLITDKLYEDDVGLVWEDAGDFMLDNYII